MKGAIVSRIVGFSEISIIGVVLELRLTRSAVTGRSMLHLAPFGPPRLGRNRNRESAAFRGRILGVGETAVSAFELASRVMLPASI